MSSELARAIWTIKTARSVDELTKRYRRLCKLYHPDVHESQNRKHYERHMQQINEAYNTALKQFNIYTFKKPKAKKGPTVVFHDDLRKDPPKKAWAEPKQDTPPPKEKLNQEFLSAEARREMGRALAALKFTPSFCSLKAAKADEIHRYDEAFKVLETLHNNYPRLKEGQDALYYMAIIQCHLKNFKRALTLFYSYREMYPDHNRNSLFHFYAGLCYHRMGRYDLAKAEYGFFLLSKPGRQYQHFLALVVSFQDAAKKNITPLNLPYN